MSWTRGSDIQLEQSLVRSKILVAGRSCQHCCLYYSTRLLIYVGGKKKQCGLTAVPAEIRVQIDAHQSQEGQHHLFSTFSLTEAL